MPPELGPFRKVEVLPSTLRLDEERIWNTVTFSRATLAPYAKNAQHHDEYAPDEHIYKWEETVDPSKGQTKADELPEKPREYAVDRIACHIGKGADVRYVIRWSG